MSTVFQICQWLCAATFGIAALAKIFGRQLTYEGMQGFGVSRAAVPIFYVSLVAIEILVAVFVMVPSLVIQGAWLAVTLLIAFSAVITMALLRGRRPACACFGQATSRPISAGTLVRNVALMAPPLYIIIAAENDLNITFEGWSISSLSQFNFIIAAMQFWFLFMLFRQNGRLLLRLDRLESRSNEAPLNVQIPQGLRVGETAPNPIISSPQKKGKLLSIINRNSANILVFVHADCNPCRQTLRDLDDLLSVAIIKPIIITDKFDSSMADERQTLEIYESKESISAYKISGTPAAILINADGNVGSQTALGREAVLNLIMSSFAHLEHSQPSASVL